jgi:probable addiction module antidote protein
VPKRTQNYQSWRLSKLANRDTAAAYLSAAMNDSTEMFRKALRIVAQARQMARVAREAGVTRESLYRATSDIGNPTLDTLRPVLRAVGIKIRFEADDASVAPVAPNSGTISSQNNSPRSRLYTVKKVDASAYGIGATGYYANSVIASPNTNLMMGSNVGQGDHQYVPLKSGTAVHHDVGRAANQSRIPDMPTWIPQAEGEPTQTLI